MELKALDLEHSFRSAKSLWHLSDIGLERIASKSCSHGTARTKTKTEKGNGRPPAGRGTQEHRAQIKH